jgi:hypothetical protein
MAPNNVLAADISEDGSSTANIVTGTGANNLSVTADDPAAIAAAGVGLEDQVAVSDLADATMLAAYTNGELVYRARGTDTVTFVPRSGGVDDIYRPWDDFFLGDQVYLSGQQGLLPA